MKFIHSGDIHLGAAPESGKPWAVDREKEIWRTFENMVKQADAQEVDLLILAGDLFHRQPLKRELKEVNSMFAALKKTKVALIAGNHDCIRKDSYYRTFEWSDNVYFIKSEDISKISIDELNVDIYGLSYYTNDITERKYDEIIIENPERINILMAHGGDEKHIPVNRRKLALCGFDYIAFGHIHIPEIDSEHRLAYCGSLEPIDVNDVGERGYILGNITKDILDLKFVPFSKRVYKHVHIKINPDITNARLSQKIKEIIKENGADNIFKFTVSGFKDPDVEFDFGEISTYGNIVKIIDNTEPDYDFEKLYANNRDNMVGMFIKKFGETDKLDDIQRKALYYGTRALLGAMEDR